ncbi:MAG: ribonuclease P protein component [Marinicaulis sp.]|nr:ribonuclease P protein component [Marinicaulis sp.]
MALRDGKRASSPGFLMVSRKNPENGETARFGLTVTKKLGGAVTRNRIRRRLRAAAKAVFPNYARPGDDYVLIARAAAYDRNYAALLDDMKRALLRLSRAPK